MDDETRLDPRCPRCGDPLPPDAREGLCPACLLTAGVETLTGRSSGSAVTVAARGASTPESPRLAPGATWGPYRIGRLLGRGGMGEVYEAEHVDSGRRLALKVLSGRFQHAEDRARFLREGQLAASISHPHTVYIFGSEEIGGVPVISMELLAGGTLKDRVAADGPLDPADAAAAVLEIIGGLDAAQAAGILHRDIKPSNCFTDIDGTVKVGDFGLSISTLARDVRHDWTTGGFQGTPHFAAPEQLRGEPLDVRADIYAVGATLYYLLTGKPPLDARDLQDLVRRVTSEAPPSPRVRRPEVPAGLASVVLWCLAKTPAERPTTYAALADALRPFTRHEVAPAARGVRLLAAVCDSLVASLLFTLSVALTAGTVSAATTSATAWSWLVTAGYYLVTEGYWGASLGKRLFGLRVTAGGLAATWSQVAVRTAVFYAPSLLVSLVLKSPVYVLAGGDGGGRITLDRTGVAVLLTLGLFLWARRSNGWAALHDLASGTRVVSRLATSARRMGTAGPVASGPRSPAGAVSGVRFGPFVGVSDLGESGSGRLVAAFDPVLRRAVWIHRTSDGTPTVSAARRDVARIGRLHWLAGKRSAEENWDAFEAPDGAPLIVTDVGGWPVVKHRLLDLANELTAAERDSTLPPLGLDRVWVRSDGRVVILDFPAPGVAGSAGWESAASPLAPVAVLSAVARPALASGEAPVPLSVRHLLDRLAHGAPMTLDEARRRLRDVAAVPDRVTATRRSIPIGLAVVPVALFLAAAALAVPSFVRLISPENAEMIDWLDALRAPSPAADNRLSDPDLRLAAEQYVTGRYRSALEDDDIWAIATTDGHLAALRKTADELLVRYPTIPDEELARVSALLAPDIERIRLAHASDADVRGAVDIIVMALAACSLAFVLVCGLVSSLIVPGGVVTRTIGLAVVTADGREIRRGRSLTRAAIAWLPAIVWMGYLAQSPRIQGFVPAPNSPLTGTVLTLGLMVAGAAWTIARPGRGIHDRLAGTWVVPR